MNKFIIIDKQTRNLCSPDVFRRTDFSGVGSGLFFGITAGNTKRDYTRSCPDVPEPTQAPLRTPEGIHWRILKVSYKF